MFYSQDLLCRRNGRFGLVWILANSHTSCHWKRISSKDVKSIDIPSTCSTILSSSAPLALRLSSALLVGLARALDRKVSMLHAECHSIWVRMLSTPWIISPSSNAHILNTVISNPQTTLLSEFATFKERKICSGDAHSLDANDKLNVGVWTIIAQSPHVASLATYTDPDVRRTMIEFGWLGDSRALDSKYSAYADALSESANMTKDWATISLLDEMPQARHAGSRSTDSVEYNLLGNGNGAESPEFYFDNEGDVHFPVATGYSSRNTEHSTQVNTRVLCHFPASTRDSARLDVSDRADLQVSVISKGDEFLDVQDDDELVLLPDLEGSVDEHPLLNQTDAGISSSFYSPLPKDQGRKTKPDTGDRGGAEGALGGDTGLLESAENEALLQYHNEKTLATTLSCIPSSAAHYGSRERLCKRKLRELCDSSSETYVSSVDGLWGESCYWQRSVRMRTDRMKPRFLPVASSKYALSLLGRAKVPCSIELSNNNSIALLFSDRGAYSERHSQYNSEWNLSSPPTELPELYSATDHSSENNHGIDEYEPELGRAQSQPADEELERSLNVGIPWLDPGLLKQTQNIAARSRSGSLSVHTESMSVQATPNIQCRSSSANSHRSHPQSSPSLNPQTLEVADYELAAAGPDGENVHLVGVDQTDADLDSFLEVNRTDVKAKPGSVGGLDTEHWNFYQFVTTKILYVHGGGSGGAKKVLFANLVEPPHHTRRVAARAFLGLLQLLTRSLLNVRQESPYGDIIIF